MLKSISSLTNIGPKALVPLMTFLMTTTAHYILLNDIIWTGHLWFMISFFIVTIYLGLLGLKILHLLVECFRKSFPFSWGHNQRVFYVLTFGFCLVEIRIGRKENWMEWNKRMKVWRTIFSFIKIEREIE